MKTHTLILTFGQLDLLSVHYSTKLLPSLSVIIVFKYYILGLYLLFVLVFFFLTFDGAGCTFIRYFIRDVSVRVCQD